MRPDPSLLWTWHRTIDRVPYLLTGVLFFAFKFLLDSAVAWEFFDQSWSPMNYLIWPGDRTLRVFDLTDPERNFSLTMLLISLPFIWVGIMLTLHRLRAAGLPRPLIVLFFVPVVNLLLFLVLSLLPSRAVHDAVAVAEDDVARMSRIRRAHRRIVRESYWLSGLVALLTTVPLTIGAVVLGANVLENYGVSLFLGAPFALGMFSVLIFGFSRPQSLAACMIVATIAATLAGLAIVVVALEGVICLIMAAPIAYALAFLGALVGYAIQVRPWLGEYSFGIMLAVLLTLPGIMAAESRNEPEPAVRAVRTEVVIAAPPDTVWRYVISFPPLPEPDDWIFRAGVAYPQRAEIHGQGVGACRHCIFSTGTFVEPIEIWDAPRLLHFRVTDQPEPMREWSPYPIHPAHLDHYLVSKRGQFLLEVAPDGKTRLEGTTWYTNRMWPAPYWGLWSDWIIGRIHTRVLAHIKERAEGSE